MADPRQTLIDELVAERFTPVYRSLDRAAASMPDSPAAVAERQRVLNASVDGQHLVVVEVTEAAA